MGEIDIRRVYNASPQRLWDAWTQPDQLASWWGKRGWKRAAVSRSSSTSGRAARFA